MTRDCGKEYPELFNWYGDPEYAEVVKTTTATLEELMEEIDDEPCHPSDST